LIHVDEAENVKSTPHTECYINDSKLAKEETLIQFIIQDREAYSTIPDKIQTVMDDLVSTPVDLTPVNKQIDTIVSKLATLERSVKEYIDSTPSKESVEIIVKVAEYPDMINSEERCFVDSVLNPTEEEEITIKILLNVEEEI